MARSIVSRDLDRVKLEKAMSELQETKDLLKYAQPKNINGNVAIEKIDIALDKIKETIFNYN